MIGTKSPREAESTDCLDASADVASANDANDSAAQTAPWQDPSFLGPSPGISAFGYMEGKEPAPCGDFDALGSSVAWDKARNVRQVWTPDSPWLLPPEEVPALFGDLYHREQLYRKHALKSTFISGLMWVVWGITRYAFRDLATGIFFILAFMGVPLLQAAWEVRRAPSYSQREALQTGEQTRFVVWVSRQRSPLTWCLVAAITFKWLAQFASLFAHFGNLGENGWSATSAAALVKRAVWEQGEWWRLFTASVMHTSIWHIAFNMFALLLLGKIVEAIAGWQRFATVFLLSALTGSIFSLLLLPATSLGSSGGIMGLMGFVLAVGYLRAGVLPRGFLKSMLSGVALTFAVGLVGFMLIDNAAHLGGVLCGALLGAISSRNADNQKHVQVPLPANQVTNLLGFGAVVALVMTIAMTLLRLFQPA